MENMFHAPDGRKYAFKVIKFLQKEDYETNLSNALKEIFLLKVGSVLKIGP